MMTDTSTVPQYPEVTPYGAPKKTPEGLSAKTRANAQVALRRFGMATAGLRVRPDYLIIGTKRGGTTSLARWVLEHPEVRPLFPSPENRKGAYYFDVNYGRGDAWYRSHFPTRMAHNLRCKRAGRKLLVGEATPYYLYHPHAAGRARRTTPQSKIIILLRNPIDRAFGHWGERTRQGIETLGFEEALDAEQLRCEGEEDMMLHDPGYVSFPHQHYSYVDQGRYSRGLKRWMDAYPSEQLLILRSEDMYQNPSAIYRQVVDFLGISDYSPKAFSAWNKKSKDTFDPALRARLTDELTEDIQKVEELVGRSMDWV